MKQDAERNATEDRRRREVIDARNQADSLVYQVEKLVNENRDKLNPADIAAIEEALKQTKEAMESGDLERIRAAMDTLNSASHQMAQTLYGQASTGGPDYGAHQAHHAEHAGGCSGGSCSSAYNPPPDNDYVDAEWRPTGTEG